MTTLLVPIQLDVLMVRDATTTFAPTKMATPAPSQTQAKRQQLLPPPFGADLTRPVGAYLQWALPDALTRARPPAPGQPPVFPALPERWLILRFTGNAAGPLPRAVTAWLIPDVNAQPPTPIANALGTAAPSPGASPAKPITVLGTGDLSWSAYYDNVTNLLALHDSLDGVAGAVSYLVCGWYTHIGLDPLNGVAATELRDYLADRNWALPDSEPAEGAQSPTSTLLHGAAVGLGWPQAGWPGDGGTLSVEAGGPPDPAGIDVVIAETLAEATAALTVTAGGEVADPLTQRLVQATLEGMLAQLAQPDGPAKLDTALHMSRFAALASDIDSETIWQSSDLPPAATATTSQPNAVGTHGLAAAVAQSRRHAGLVPQETIDSAPDIGGSLVGADRSTPRTYAPVDPVILLRNASRSFKHGGDGRFTEDQTLLVRLSGDTVTSFRAAGEPAVDASTMLPVGFAASLATLTPPDDVLALVNEVVSLDPTSAPDLSSATSTQPSADAAARAAWLNDPTTPPAPASATVLGVLPSPVAIIGPVRPWVPLHIEWQLDWSACRAGVHGFQLGDIDFVVPDSDALPDLDAPVTMSGRSLLSAGPARIAAGGVQTATNHLADADVLDGHAIGAHLAEVSIDLAAAGGRAALTGASGAAADQDLLGGSLEDFLAALRGENTMPVVRPPGSTSADASNPTNPDVVRAGFARIRRVRVVDAFGQYLDLLDSSASHQSDGTTVVVGASQAVNGAPGLIALVPRFNAKARVLLRYAAADGTSRDADTAISPLCGFVLPSLIDGSLEFFDANGAALGRVRADDVHGALWEEDPGQPPSFGRQPSSAITGNAFLGKIADGIVNADVALAVNGAAAGQQTALEALTQLIDVTRWTIDANATTGDEHAALLLGHPIAVMRAAVRVEVQGAAPHNTSANDALPVKLGTLAHSQDGLLAYFLDDDYSKVRCVDPAAGAIVPPGGQPIDSQYVDLSASFDVQPGQALNVTLLIVPGSELHATLGLLPQKDVGMRRDWVSAPLAALTPNWRYGPVLLDAQTTRLPLAADVRGIWTWYHRPSADTWTSENAVNANATAILPETPPIVQDGWLRLALTADPNFRGIPVQVSCITKPIRDAHHRIQGIGGLNPDNTRWWMSQAQAIQMIQTGRFFFYLVDSKKQQIQIVTDQTPSGSMFIRTVADNDTSNNLETLPECPSH